MKCFTNSALNVVLKCEYDDDDDHIDNADEMKMMMMLMLITMKLGDNFIITLMLIISKELLGSCEGRGRWFQWSCPLHQDHWGRSHAGRH